MVNSGDRVREWGFETVLINASVMFYFLIKIVNIYSKCFTCLKYFIKKRYWIIRF